MIEKSIVLPHNGEGPAAGSRVRFAADRRQVKAEPK